MATPNPMARERISALLRQLLQLVLLGLLVGLACWPFNLLDHWQDELLHQLPSFSGKPWRAATLLLACSPLLAVPLLLLLQRGVWAAGAGSGIPQTMASVEDPARAPGLLGPWPTLQRLGLWAIATLSLLPLGREGPVVQVGAAVAQALRRRFPRLLSDLSQADLLAVAAGAGLAGGFNTPLMGVVFVAEEFTGRFAARLIWPALVICSVAAAFSNLAGQPEFALGTLGVEPLELMQVLWAIPMGLLGGLLGAGFGLLLLALTRRFIGLARRRPLPLGLVLGALLSLFLLVSGGASGGDGEALMGQLIAGEHPRGLLGSGLLGDLLTLGVRVVGPALALGAGIPGGLIDPAFSFGALLGHGLGALVGLSGLGLALGMVAGLAGATQLPVMTVLFALRLAGDQQLLPGMLVASVLAAFVSRLLVAQPIYHALAEVSRPSAGVRGDHQG
jgi:H+/Cl- antiporter ClcA